MFKDDEIMTSEDVAKLLNTTKGTIFKLVREGKIAAAMVGNSYRFLRSEVEAFLRVGKEVRGMQKKEQLFEDLEQFFKGMRSLRD